MKCSEIKVIKKDGTKEEFNVQKVLAAVNKSANRAMIIFSKAETNLSVSSWRRRRTGPVRGADRPDAQYRRGRPGARQP